MTDESGVRCVNCGAPLEVGDQFCEECGARVVEVESTSSSDRTELDLGVAAAASDRGCVHRRNEDAFQLEVLSERTVAAVVCDGISLASAGDAAARTAAAAAGAVMQRAIGEESSDTAEAIADAIRAAQKAVEEVEWTTRTGKVMPSCTIVAAIWRNREIAVGWAGDSRAYWIAPEARLQLTVDDSFAAEAVADGVMTPEEAARSPFMHLITHWVGPDAPGRPPRVLTFRPDSPGRLLLCTDGLWNYAATADELGGLMDALGAGATPATVARALADIAVARGGRDNITVAVIGPLV
jgi:serine/threonine protein phosphatase PrpC